MRAEGLPLHSSTERESYLPRARPHPIRSHGRASPVVVFPSRRDLVATSLRSRRYVPFIAQLAKTEQTKLVAEADRAEAAYWEERATLLEVRGAAFGSDRDGPRIKDSQHLSNESQIGHAHTYIAHTTP